MTSDEAFNRRFYADRAELAVARASSSRSRSRARATTRPRPTRSRPRTSTCRRSSSPTSELGALRTALTLLDGEFAYAEPLRLALQQLSWGKPSPLSAPEQQSVRARDDRRAPAGASCRSGCRRSRPRSSAARRSCSTTTRWAATPRRSARSTPTTCSSAAASSTSSATRTSATTCASSALSRIRGKVGYSLEGRARLPAPRGLRPARVRHARRLAARRHGGPRADLAVGPDRLARAPPLRPTPATVEEADGGVIFETDYGDSRQLVSWVLGLGEPRARSSSRRSWSRRPSERVRAGRRAPLRARSSWRPPVKRRSRRRGAPTTTASARRRSAPSASRAWSRSRAS